MWMAYMIQALDKGVIGPASIMGWLPDIGAQGQDYALTSTILWIGIIAGEPLVSRRVPSWTGMPDMPGKPINQEVETCQDIGNRDVHLERRESRSLKSDYVRPILIFPSYWQE
jgi:hypothetical protein